MPPSPSAYLDRLRHADLAGSRRTLAVRTKRPVTFGWGPRFLHSTGQLHKGGPAVGVYLQVTAEPDPDLGVPGRDYTFGRLIAAQAAGADGRAREISSDFPAPELEALGMARSRTRVHDPRSAL